MKIVNINDFEKRQIAINNWKIAVDRMLEVLRGYYFAQDGKHYSNEFLLEEAVDMFAEKKKNGFFTELNEPVNDKAFTLTQKGKVLFFKRKAKNATY